MQMLQLEINQRAKNIMERDAVESFPNECCGFFFGTERATREIDLAIPVGNKREGDQRRRFTIDPSDYMWAEKYALEHDLQLLGIYHSHPLHPAHPSEHDRKQAMPWFSYIILSVEKETIHDINSFQLNEARQFEQEQII